LFVRIQISTRKQTGLLFTFLPFSAEEKFVFVKAGLLTYPFFGAFPFALNSGIDPKPLDLSKDRDLQLREQLPICTAFPFNLTNRRIPIENHYGGKYIKNNA
jgi:hypothetical protein